MDSTVKVVQGLCKIFVMMVLAILIVSVAFLSGFGAGFSLAPARPAPVAAAGEGPSEFAVFWEAWHLIESEFYGDLPTMQEVTYGAIRGVLVALGDDGTSFIDPEHAAVMREDITGSFEGIGAVVNMLPNGRLIIVEPLPGRPAAQAGIQRGDLVLKVDDTPIQNMTLMEAVSLIRGPAGTTVHLTVLRKGVKEPFEVTIVRERVELEVVESRMLDDDIAYVRLTEFNAKATKELTKALRELMAQEPKGLIFDLRSNPGGFLQTSVEVTSQFLDEGLVLTEKGKGGVEKAHPVESGGLATEVPLVVLINVGSASASEIVAGAIQDSGRGILVGERSFGKGSVQLPHTLSDGSELRVTIARWFTPKDREIQGLGIIPDIEVEMTLEDLEAGNDPQLERAVEYLLTEK
ncbi:MAG: S41 family peptidase [Anaerolineales bacterium]|nr:MAG: S41 family peptidase [Anaerolineales bacterium]